jgi:hypothetical protein
LYEDFVGGRIFLPVAEFFGRSGRKVWSGVGNTAHEIGQGFKWVHWTDKKLKVFPDGILFLI